MKNLLTIVLCHIIFALSGQSVQKQSYKDRTIKCSYETSSGRIHGPYVSYYKNGQKRAEGKFENNYRAGKWTVWDSTGRIRMQRDYTDPFTFRRIVPQAPQEGPALLFMEPRYKISYNAEGFVDCFKLQERMVVWEKRIWRQIWRDENPLLFNENALFNVLAENINSGAIQAFHPKYDDFRTELDTKVSVSDYEIIAYKIVEDSFFDNERLVSETRIIGICPVAVNKLNRDTADLFWVYFPAVRKYIAHKNVTGKEVPAKVKTLDDLFFYRCFYGKITKEANMKDKAISEYAKGIEADKEAERIEISIIEAEHDIWLQFTK